MRLTTYSDYALRLLMFVAVRQDAEDSNVTIGEASKAYGISKNHLMKIAHHLSLEGILESVRGRNGGLRLAKPAGEINIGAVLRLTEASSPLVECFDPETNECVITKACGLKHMLNHALEDFYKRLDQYSLADLVRNQKAFSGFLKVEA